MRWGNLLDPVAERLLVLQTVSGTQWLLRSLGAVTTVLALLLAAGTDGLFSHIGTTMLSLLVAAAVLLQLRNPDSDLGLLAPGAIVLTLVWQDDLTMLRAAGVGGLLLLAHSASALAATLPVHGEFSASAWRLAGRALLPVLGVSLLGALLVAVLAGVQLGPWMMVPGSLAVIMLLAVVLPRAE